MQILFSVLIVLQFLVIVSHDLLDVPGWTHGRQVRAVIGRRKLWAATLINAVFPAVAAGAAISFWNRPTPPWVGNYWVIYCAITVGSAIAMWYVPYLLGCDEKRKLEYSRMYAGTHQVLPPRGDNPRPNLLHVCFHILFVINLGLALLIRF